MGNFEIFSKSHSKRLSLVNVVGGGDLGPRVHETTIDVWEKVV